MDLPPQAMRDILEHLRTQIHHHLDQLVQRARQHAEQVRTEALAQIHAQSPASEAGRAIPNDEAETQLQRTLEQLEQDRIAFETLRHEEVQKLEHDRKLLAEAWQQIEQEQRALAQAAAAAAAATPMPMPYHNTAAMPEAYPSYGAPPNHSGYGMPPHGMAGSPQEASGFWNAPPNGAHAQPGPPAPEHHAAPESRTGPAKPNAIARALIEQFAAMRDDVRHHNGPNPHSETGSDHASAS